jgi:ParB-like chromosome segregation protein Spo0J
MASGVPVHCAHTKILKVEELVPNPRNPNQHGKEQIALLAKIIKAQGWRSPIVTSKRSGFVVKGHGRLAAAKLLQVTEVPVDIQDYASEATEWSDMIADNQIAELADLSTELLSSLVLDLGKTDFDLSLTALSQDEINQMLGKVVPEDEEPQFIPEKWGVLIDCASEEIQRQLLDKFTQEGLACRALLS